MLPSPLPFDVRRIVCDVIGHSLDAMESDYIGCQCYRCGEVFMTSAPKSDLGFWLTWYAIKDKYRSLWWWWRRFLEGKFHIPF